MPAEDCEQVGVLVLSIRTTPHPGDLVAELTTIDALDAERHSATVCGNRCAILSAVDTWISGLRSADEHPE